MTDPYDLRSLQTPSDYANLVRLLRERYTDYTILLLEGDTDARFYRKYLHPKCEIVVTDGKEKAVIALQILAKKEEDLQGVVSVLDADYWHLEKSPLPSKSTFLTDKHDLEGMLLISEALENYIYELVPGKKGHLVQKIAETLRETILAIGLPMGCLRWIDSKEHWNLSFKALSFSEVINLSALEFNIEQAITIIGSESPAFKSSTPELLEKMNQILDSSPDPWQLCRGHDLVHILSVIIGKIIHDESKVTLSDAINSRAINRGLRMAYTTEFFRATDLFSDIIQWQLGNIPFKVFKMSN